MFDKGNIGKTSVSILNEFCAKKKISAPTYEWIDSSDGVFTCRIYVMDIEIDGIGRSKRDAKHIAAANAIKKLRVKHHEINDISQMELMDPNEIPIRDMIVTLRDYCVQHNHPLPTIEIVQEGGTPHAPLFVALCTIASIKRLGISDKKKDARQKAAAAMYTIIQNRKCDAVDLIKKASLDDSIRNVEYERYKKFRSYRELTETPKADPPGTLLCERHNYFQKYYDEIKANARTVLSGTYEDEQQQVMDLFKALKITPKINKIPGTVELLVTVDIDCEYDVHFIDFESKIYSNMLEYFRDMLN